MTKGERLTITLGRGQRQKLAKIAHERRTSTATVIRWAVDDFIVRNSGSQRLKRAGMSQEGNRVK
jgi:predicted transcriptional regulator